MRKRARSGASGCQADAADLQLRCSLRIRLKLFFAASHLTRESCRSKAELCASVDAIAFIDDNETYIHEVAHSFIEAAKAKAEAEAARAAAGATAGTSTHDASASASTAPAPGRLPHSDPGTVILFGQYAWQHSHKPEAASAGAAPVMPHNVRRAHSWREVHALLMSLLPSTAAAMAVAAVA